MCHAEGEEEGFSFNEYHVLCFMCIKESEACDLLRENACWQLCFEGWQNTWDKTKTMINSVTPTKMTK